MKRLFIIANLALIAAAAYFGVSAGYRVLALRLDDEDPVEVKATREHDVKKETF